MSKENSNSKRQMQQNIHSSSVYDSQGMIAKCPSTEEKEDMVHIANGILISHKKKK